MVCKCIALDAVTPFVYTAPIEAVIEPGHFENAFKGVAFSRRYGFIGRKNSETALIRKRLSILARNWLARED